MRNAVIRKKRLKAERYEHDFKMRPTRIVLGASMAGLAAARALSRHFEHVTLVERDALSEPPSFPTARSA